MHSFELSSHKIITKGKSNFTVENPDRQQCKEVIKMSIIRNGTLRWCTTSQAAMRTETCFCNIPAKKKAQLESIHEEINSNLGTFYITGL